MLIVKRCRTPLSKHLFVVELLCLRLMCLLHAYECMSVSARVWEQVCCAIRNGCVISVTVLCEPMQFYHVFVLDFPFAVRVIQLHNLSRLARYSAAKCFMHRHLRSDGFACDFSS